VSAVIQLGRIESVDLRTAWPDEAKNFTPWLAAEENLALLGSVLGLQLELEAVEKQVGPFSADILAKECPGGRWVLIENQMEMTDHAHLGQILTYAAGLDVAVVVWIARSFREQHRAAIDYLNRVTDEDHLFFGIQVELLKIGESAFAPSFSVVAKPNDWSKQSAAAKFAADDVLSPTQVLYREFWTGLIAAAKEAYPSLASRKPYKGGWQTAERIGSGPGFAIDANASFTGNNQLRVEAYVSGPAAPIAFQALSSRKAEIESNFGAELAWELLQGTEKRIAFYMPGQQKKDVKEAWPSQHAWLLQHWKKLADSIRPAIGAVRAEVLAAQE
jgi:Domain of unknown function (DUF4268)